jgi:hypothetical protein
LIKRIALLIMITILSLSAPALAAEPGSGLIEGQVVNGTEGSGSSAADQDITLKTYLMILRWIQPLPKPMLMVTLSLMVCRLSRAIAIR